MSSVYKCAVLIHFARRLRVWVGFESVTVFDIVIHRFIYCFLLLNQLGLSVMVMSHVDISAHLHLSNISDLFLSL